MKAWERLNQGPGPRGSIEPFQAFKFLLYPTLLGETQLFPTAPDPAGSTMSMFRKFRIGSGDSGSQPRDDDESIPPMGDLEDPDSKIRSLPYRSQSEPFNVSQSIASSNRHLSVASEDTLVSIPSSSQLLLQSGLQSPPGTDDPLGLSLIHGDSNSDGDIIFVHGLGGSSRKTWSWERRPENFWPAWIRHEDGLSHFRVFSYGYNANFKDSKNPLSILDFSKGLLVHMKTYTGGAAIDDIGLKPIIFVAHSMGGLVVKKALVIGKNDDIYSLMLSKVHGIMFLSTPHRGSQYARTLNNFLSITLGASKVYVSELESSSTSIEDISEQFRGICGPWKLASLYETLSTKFLSGVRRLIVGKDSGVLNYPQEITAPVDADHHTIVKFNGPRDTNYILVTNVLRQLTRGLQSKERPELHIQDSTYDSGSHILEKMFGLQGSLRDRLEANLSSAHPGSCQWLFNSSSFNTWLNSPDQANRVLWLTGLPGTGKSTLAAKAVDHIQRSFECQFHFLLESHPIKRSAAYCLRAIAYQMASEHPDFAERLLRLHQDTQFTAVSQSFQVIWETIFENIVFQMDFGSTLYWIIDGLEEADTPVLLVRHLIQIRSRNPIKVLLFSRPKRELTSLVGSRLDSVSIEPILIEHTMADIQNFVSSATSEVLPQDGHLQELVVSQIANRAEGSFLWTRLALDSLWDNWHTQTDIDTALGKIPHDMKALYERMIRNVESQPPRHQEIAFRILTWASCAFRPLTVAELDSALRPEFDGFVNLGETVVQICGQFIRVDHEVISLIHSTARQFLLHSSNGTAPVVGLHVGHDHLARVCLQYMCHDSWRQILARVSEVRKSTVHDRLDPLYGEFPFLKYAINHWAYHVRHASVDSPDLLLNLRLFCSKYMLQWIHAMALSSNMAAIPKAAQYLKKWLRERRKRASMGINLEESAFLAKWATDLIRVVGTFGTNLLQSPSSIHRHIPPFCPENSIISRTYSNQDNPLICVKGLSTDSWDDKLARLALGEDEMASAICCGTIYFFTLTSHSGTVVVWHIETCEELRRLCHSEWVMRMAINKSGSLVATAGRFTYRVWDPASGHALHILDKSYQARPISLAFAKTDTELLVGYDDCAVISYNIESSKHRLIFQGPGQNTSLGNCARFMSLSPDHTKVAIGFRGRPVVVWELTEAPISMFRSAIRTADKDRLENGEDVYNSPEIVRWKPDSSVVYILYQDAAILVWNLIDDTQAEFDQTEAREMSLNVDGTLLLTSSNSGSISVWGLPKFNLIYRLHCDGFVRDLAFGSDAQRIYDVRGSGCNVWAPDALIGSDEPEREETTSSNDGSYLSEVPSEPVIAEDQSRGGRITALACDSEDEFFCCGRDDGSVTIHDMGSGAKVRKVCNHSTTVDIIAIEWSSSRRLVASADDSGKVIVKRLRIKPDGKWAVYPLLDLRVGEAVLQILFSSDEAYFLISTETTDRLWDIKKKAEVCKRRHGSRSMRKWLNHPTEDSQLLRVAPNKIDVHHWESLNPMTGIEEADEAAVTLVDASRVSPGSSTGSPAANERLRNIVQSSNHHFLLYEVMPMRNVSRRSSGARIELVDMRDLKPGRPGGDKQKRKTLEGLGQGGWQLLGNFRDRVVFLDHKNWICTCNIGWEMGSIKRHFFFPREWVNDTASHVLVLSRQGTLLCARNGEVAIICYSKGF